FQTWSGSVSHTPRASASSPVHEDPAVAAQPDQRPLLPRGSTSCCCTPRASSAATGRSAGQRSTWRAAWEKLAPDQDRLLAVGKRTGGHAGPWTAPRCTASPTERRRVVGAIGRDTPLECLSGKRPEAASVVAGTAIAANFSLHLSPTFSTECSERLARPAPFAQRRRSRDTLAESLLLLPSGTAARRRGKRDDGREQPCEPSRRGQRMPRFIPVTHSYSLGDLLDL